MPFIALRRILIPPYYLSLLFWIISAGLTVAQVKKNESASLKKKREWVLYPLTLQLNTQGGMMWPHVTLTDTYKGRVDKKLLFITGGSLDISLLYVREEIWKIFDCFPKLGLLGKYARVLVPGMNEPGYIVGGVFYLEPNYFHLKGFEIVPRIGVGVSQVYVPGDFYSGPTPEPEEEEIHQIDPASVEPLREGLSLNIIADLLFKFRITPRWHINFGLGADLLPDFEKVNDSQETAVDSSGSSDPNFDRSLKFYNVSLSCGYTFNPSDYNPEPEPTRKSRIDLSFVSAFRQIPLCIIPIKSNDKTEPKPFSSKEYYYIGGIHAQWTVQLARYHGLVIGTEWVKDWATQKTLMASAGIIKTDIKASFLLGHEFLWGKVVLGQYLGYYVLNETPNLYPNASILNNRFYTQLGLIIKITDWLHVGSSIRHLLYFFAPANKNSLLNSPPLPISSDLEYIDFKIGYSF